jgi:hypothetical protein
MLFITQNKLKTVNLSIFNMDIHFANSSNRAIKKNQPNKQTRKQNKTKQHNNKQHNSLVSGHQKITAHIETTPSC